MEYWVNIRQSGLPPPGLIIVLQDPENKDDMAIATLQLMDGIYRWVFLTQPEIHTQNIEFWFAIPKYPEWDMK